MIQADLLFNLPPTEQVKHPSAFPSVSHNSLQYSKSKSFSKVPFISNVGPSSWAQRRLAWSLGVDKESV